MKLVGLGVLVVGLGASGRAAALVCAEAGARVVATDLGDASRLGQAVAELADRGVRLVLNRHDVQDFATADLVVISPGVPLDLPELRAKRDAVELIGELELASRLLGDLPMVAITGSNGKSTVTAWLGQMLERSGLDVFVGGNLGRPLCELVLEGGRPDWAVVEVSSYQLDTASRFSPRAAGLLNLSPDHLDRYPGLEAYYASKVSLLERLDAEGSALVGPDAAALKRTGWLGRRRFVVDLETEVERGVFRDGGTAVWRDGRGGEERYDLDGLRVAGRHNLANALCSLGLARLCGASVDGVRAGLASFTGLAHRMQLVRERNGVRYYDDSKGTNAGAVAAGLLGFEKGRVLLIAGGKDKGTGYGEMVDAVREHVKLLLLIGEAAGAMDAALAAHVPEVLRCAGGLSEAVARAAERAEPGDVVLLSPACSSFDQFRDYRERGRAFGAAVEALS